MRALVTGGGGFLGRAIVEQLLARGDQVRILARGSYPELESSGVECLRGDIRELESVERACAGVGIVFHTAAIAGIWGPWREFYEINALGTLNLISACRKQSVRRLVFTSSPSVTFDGSPQEGVDESVPYPRRWLCHYQRTKAQAEQAVLEASDSELLACALRPHLIWGPGDPHLLPRLLDRARAGYLRRVGAGDNLIDTIYVDNAARAHLQAGDGLQAGSRVAGRAYFISQGEPVNCWAWIDELLALNGLPPVERAISLTAAWRIGAVLETLYRVLAIRREPRMTRFLAAQLGTSHYFDISRAQKDFDYRPLVSMAGGMQQLRDRVPSKQIAG